MKKALLVYCLAILTIITNSATLLNGAQRVVLSTAMSDTCYTSFDTDLDCQPNTAHLVSFSVQSVGWNTSMLSSLCDPACNASMAHLADSVFQGCGNDSFAFHNANLTFVDFVGYLRYKYEIICLKEDKTGDFCLDVENNWNITLLDNQHNATWPNHTHKEYFDVETGLWGPLSNADGSSPSLMYNPEIDPNRSDAVIRMTGEDYFMQRNDTVCDNYGWPEPLEMDEYPLEIQCSNCQLDAFALSVQSRWGEAWDEVTEQAWENVRPNCHISYTLLPASNISGLLPDFDPAAPSKPNRCAYCPRSIAPNEDTQTCEGFGMQHGVATAALAALNGGSPLCSYLGTDEYCLPDPCPAAVINTRGSPLNFTSWFNNFTYQQFLSWNPFLINLDRITIGDVVCVGPTTDMYVPNMVEPELPPAPTVVVTNVLPTASGTSSRCGHFYGVQPNEYCDLIALRFSITFAQLRELNPSIDVNCTNLLAGNDYCVTAVPSEATSTA